MAKFFAVVESERARKHQIGNQYIECSLFTGNKENSIPVGTLRMEEAEDGHVLVTFDGEEIDIGYIKAHGGPPR